MCLKKSACSNLNRAILKVLNFQQQLHIKEAKHPLAQRNSDTFELDLHLKSRQINPPGAVTFIFPTANSSP